MIYIWKGLGRRSQKRGYLERRWGWGLGGNKQTFLRTGKAACLSPFTHLPGSAQPLALVTSLPLHKKQPVREGDGKCLVHR